MSYFKYDRRGKFRNGKYSKKEAKIKVGLYYFCLLMAIRCDNLLINLNLLTVGINKC